MLNFTIIASYSIIAVVLVVWSIILRDRQAFIKSREKAVGMREVACDRRCEIIDTAENDLEMRFHKITKWTTEAIRVTACYVVTDSDELKFQSEQDIRDAARKQLARNIAFEILKKFNPKEEKNEFGRTRITYRFKVLEDN